MQLHVIAWFALKYNIYIYNPNVLSRGEVVHFLDKRPRAHFDCYKMQLGLHWKRLKILFTYVGLINEDHASLRNAKKKRLQLQTPFPDHTIFCYVGP